MSKNINATISQNAILRMAYAVMVVVVSPFNDAYLFVRAEYLDGSTTFVVFIRAAGVTLLLETAILLPISLFVAAILVPLAFTALYGANTSGWNPTIVTFWQLFFPAITLIALAYQYIKILVTHK